MTRLDLGQPTKNKSWEINYSFRIRSYNGKIYSSNNPQTYVGPRDNFPEVPYKPCLGHGVGLMVSTSVKWLRTENIVAQNIIKRKKITLYTKPFRIVLHWFSQLRNTLSTQTEVTMAHGPPVQAPHTSSQAWHRIWAKSRCSAAGNRLSARTEQQGGLYN